VQLMAAQAEPNHAHLLPAYPFRRGWGGTRLRAACDGWDRTPHTDKDPFSQAVRRCYAKIACFKRLFHVFKCFRGMLQVFYIDVAKISGCCTCCNGVFKCMSQTFHLFQTYVASVSSTCCIYICMLQAYVSSVSGVSYVYFKCFI
jgi:hypothetical protein